MFQFCSLQGALPGILPGVRLSSDALAGRHDRIHTVRIELCVFHSESVSIERSISVVTESAEESRLPVFTESTNCC